jgi:AcrR family transcriptional regulator
VPRDAGRTRRKLLDAAHWLFAERGVNRVTLSELTAAAGQRNSSAIPYHFGSREGLLRAVLAEHTPKVRRRRRELLVVARAAPPGDPRPAAECFVRPLADLLGGDWRERAYLRIIAELGADPSRTPRQVIDLVGDTHARAANQALLARAEPLPRGLRTARFGVAETMVMHALSDQARVLDRPAAAGPEGPASEDAGPELSFPERDTRVVPNQRLFVANLVDMYLAAVLAPVSTEVAELLPRRRAGSPSTAGH